MSSEQFLDNWKSREKIPGQAPEGYLSYSGCYVIATYSSPVRKDDYSAFRELYVGKSDNIGASIYSDLTGGGNVDIYADAKYKQHVYVLLYPCAPEKAGQLESFLIIALDANESYNRIR